MLHNIGIPHTRKKRPVIYQWRFSKLLIPGYSSDVVPLSYANIRIDYEIFQTLVSGHKKIHFVPAWINSSSSKGYHLRDIIFSTL